MKWGIKIIYFCRFIFVMNSIYDVVTLRFLQAAFLLGSVLLTFVPELFTKVTKVKIPVGARLIYVLFLLCSQWLGTYLDFYVYFFWWDIALHFISGIFIGYVALLILIALDRKMPLFRMNCTGLIVTFVFAIAVTGAGLWEIIEFLGDFFLKTTSQHGSLQDTMGDILCGTVGGIIFAIYCALVLHKKRESCIQSLVRLNQVNRKHK